MIGGGNWTPWNIGARSETLGATEASTTGVSLTSGGSAGTKGSWVDVGSPISFPYKYLIVSMQNATNTLEFALDVGINVGGNRFVIAEDLLFTARGADGGFAQYALPLNVIGGAQLSARIASDTASSTVGTIFYGFSNGIAGMAGFSRCRALHTYTTRPGITIDPGATPNTKGSWTELISACPADVAALLLYVGGEDATISANQNFIDLSIGAAASEQLILSNIVIPKSALHDYPPFSSFPIIPFFAPSGTRFSARTQSTTGTAGDRVVVVGLWGLEP